MQITEWGCVFMHRWVHLHAEFEAVFFYDYLNCHINFIEPD